jgi:hypothetical protein
LAVFSVAKIYEDKCIKIKTSIMKRRYLAIFLMLSYVYLLTACDEYVIRPVLVFDITLNEDGSNTDGEISILLHGFNTLDLEDIIVKEVYLNNEKMPDFEVKKMSSYIEVTFHNSQKTAIQKIEVIAQSTSNSQNVAVLDIP